MKKYFVMFTAMVMTFGLLSIGAGRALGITELQVDDDAVQCPSAAYSTIQAAVDDAATMPGVQKIRVCAGTYAENVSIGSGNSLKIVGDGTNNTVVTGVASTAGPIFDIDSAGHVVIKKLTVDGQSALAGNKVYGIRYNETKGVIKNTKVLNIRNASGASQGIGIRIQSTGATAKVLIVDNVVKNFTRVGINGNGEGVDILVTYNQVFGPEPPKVWAPNGIQVSRGARSLVKGNVVRDATSPAPPNGAGSGILLFCAGRTSVLLNKVFDSDLGIAIADNAQAWVIGNQVYNSLFDAYSLQFIGTLFGPLGCPNFPQPTEQNLLVGNRGFDSGETGLSFANFDPTAPMPPNNNRIIHNTFKDSGTEGIHVFEGSDNRFISNRIKSSSNKDVVDDTTGSGTAGTSNTWIANKCDTSDPTGLCH